MPGRDLWGVPDREAAEIALCLRIPECLVRLAQPGQQDPYRLASIVDDALAFDPYIQHPFWVVHSFEEAADVEVDPKALARLVLACRSRHLDEGPDDPARCGRGS